MEIWYYKLLDTKYHLIISGHVDFPFSVHWHNTGSKIRFPVLGNVQLQGKFHVDFSETEGNFALCCTISFTFPGSEGKSFFFPSATPYYSVSNDWRIITRFCSANRNLCTPSCLTLSLSEQVPVHVQTI